MAKSPRIVPGADARGFVAPRRTRPVLTTSLPSHTMAQTGPLAISYPITSVQGGYKTIAKLQVRTADETLEEGLVAQVLVMLLEMLLRCCHELDSDELVSVR